VAQIIIAAAACDLEQITAIAAAYPKVNAVIAGGASRQQSVALALAKVDEEAELVAIHDGARPLLTRVDWLSLLSAAYLSGAAILASPVTDSIKTCAGSLVGESLDRSRLIAVQTPQVFRRQLLLQAYAEAEKDQYQATDDSALVERLGVPVVVIMAKNANFKLTYADDLLLAELTLQRRRS
ncbi:MAG: 2-C-methyl-D-erythritol 4-phosphate cytidylyltransferase, partial [Clostridiales bacterium]